MHKSTSIYYRKQLCRGFLRREYNREWTFSFEEELLWTCILVRIDQKLFLYCNVTKNSHFSSLGMFNFTRSCAHQSDFKQRMSVRNFVYMSQSQ